MKITNVQFRTPFSIGGFTAEHVQAGEGTVEVLDFPWVRVTKNGKSRRTTIFNIAGCDDWVDLAPEEFDPGQRAADRQRGKKPG